MISKITDEYINKAVAAELQASNTQHRDKFTSWHEAESVMREEIEELYEAYDRLRDRFERLHSGLRGNDNSMMRSMAVQMSNSAHAAAAEAIQVAAMCDKALEMVAGE